MDGWKGWMDKWMDGWWEKKKKKWNHEMRYACMVFTS
jgi:hypothetical protein